MLFYLFSNGSLKNHPLLLKILPDPEQEKIRSFLGSVVIYCVGYIILFSPLFIRFAIEYRIWLYERFIPNSK